jgi:hypothetical protein
VRILLGNIKEHLKKYFPRVLESSNPGRERRLDEMGAFYKTHAVILLRVFQVLDRTINPAKKISAFQAASVI